MFGMSEPDQVARLRAYRERPVGPGPGAKMLAALTAWEWALGGGGADECAELAAQRSPTTRWSPPTTASSPSRHPRPGAGGPRRGAGPVGPAAAPVGRGRLAVRDLVRAPVERLHAVPPRRAGRERGAAAQRPRRAAAVGRLPVDGAYFTSSISLVRLERGDVEGAREELGRRPSPEFAAYDATTCGCAARSRSCSRRARPRRRSRGRRTTAPPSAVTSTRPGCRGARCGAGARTGSTERRGDRRRRGGARPRARLGRTEHGRAVAADPGDRARARTARRPRGVRRDPRRLARSAGAGEVPVRARRPGAPRQGRPTRATRCAARSSWPTSAVPRRSRRGADRALRDRQPAADGGAVRGRAADRERAPLACWRRTG